MSHFRRKRGQPYTIPALALAGMGVGLLSDREARAVVVYDVSGAGQNTIAPADDEGWQYMGNLNLGGAVVVAPNVILTANHLGGNSFLYNGVTYTVDNWVQVGDSDMKLGHLTVSTGSAGAPLYTGTSESGQVTIFGYGGPKGAVLSSNGTPYGWAWTPAIGNPPSWSVSALSWGQNTIGQEYAVGHDYGYLTFQFSATPGSSIYSTSDSGGGVFINSGGVYKLVGIADGVTGWYTYAQTLQYPNPATNPPPSEGVTASIYDLSWNATAAQADQLYTIVNNTYVLASSNPSDPGYSPELGYATLIDNNAYGFSVNATSLAASILSLSTTRSISTWISTSDGTWSTAGNWSPILTLNPGSVASFDGIGTQTAITVDGDKTLGSMLFSGPLGYTLSSGGEIYMDNTGGIGDALISASSPTGVTHTINATIVTTVASNLTLTVSGGGALVLGGGIDNTAGKVITWANAGGSLTITSIINNGSLISNGSATVGAISGSGSLCVNSGTLALGSASTYSGGTTVNNGTLLVNNSTGSATSSNTVTLNGGTLGGYGILSGTVIAGINPHTIAPSATLSPASTGTLTLGGLMTSSNTTLAFNLVAPNITGGSDLINISGFNGLTLNGGAIQIANVTTGAASLGYYKIMQYSGTIGGAGLGSLTLPGVVNGIVYTFDTTHDPGFIDIHRGFEGDADDNGTVNIFDFNVLANHWQQTGQSWSTGDFNGDGTVNIFDFNLLANNWQQTIGSFGGGSGFDLSGLEAMLGISDVPEPAGLSVLGAGAFGLLIRRRR